MHAAPEITPAVSLAAAWARRYLIGRRGFAAAVTGERSETLRFALVRWRGRTRRIVRRTAPTPSRARTLEAPANPDRFDPWARAPRELAEATRHIVGCPTCRGEKRVTCPSCGGASSLRCDDCAGRGHVYSPRSRRIVTCRRCRGNGVRRCSCRDGLVKCETCLGRGRVEEWLEAVEEPFGRIRTTEINLLAEALPNRGQSFEDPRATAPLAPATSWSGTAPSAAPEAVLALLARTDLQGDLDPRRDRLDGVDIQSFTASVATVSYRMFGREGEIQVQLWDETVRASASATGPLKRRLAVLAAGAFGAFLGGASLLFGYVGRHPYYLDRPQTLLLLLGSLILPLLVLSPLAQLGRPSMRTRAAAHRAWAPALLLLAGLFAVAPTGKPSLAHARELLERGSADAARREAAACADLGIEREGSSRLHDKIQLRSALATATPEAAWQAARLPFYTPDGRAAAEGHAVALTSSKGAAALTAADFAAVETLLALAVDHRANTPELRGLRARLHLERFRGCAAAERLSCMAKELTAATAAGLSEEELRPLQEVGEIAIRPIVDQYWREIRSRHPTEARLEACRAIREPLGFLASVSLASEAPAFQEQVTSQCGEVARLHEVELERARREAALRREREARAVERRRESAARSWALAPLRCRDGSLSPSCVCGQSSRRGCCSHHGGVAGCSQ